MWGVHRRVSILPMNEAILKTLAPSLGREAVQPTLK